MNSLAARKKLLVMESEVNRVRLQEAAQDWRNAFDHSREHLTSVASMASLAGKLVSAVPAIRRIFARHNKNADVRNTGISSLLNTAMTGTSIWLLLRSVLRRF